MALSGHAPAGPHPAEGGAAAHGGASQSSEKATMRDRLVDVSSSLGAALAPDAEASCATNRERYLGAARIIQIYNSIERALAGNGGAPALAQANAMAKAQAWDAWIASGEAPLKGLRGIPGGILSLAALERLSPGFSRWLDEPCGTDGALR